MLINVWCLAGSWLRLAAKRLSPNPGILDSSESLSMTRSCLISVASSCATGPATSKDSQWGTVTALFSVSLSLEHHRTYVIIDTRCSPKSQDRLKSLKYGHHSAEMLPQTKLWVGRALFTDWQLFFSLPNFPFLYFNFRTLVSTLQCFPLCGQTTNLFLQDACMGMSASWVNS